MQTDTVVWLNHIVDADFLRNTIHVFLRDPGYLHDFAGVNFMYLCLYVGGKLSFANFTVLSNSKHIFYIYLIPIHFPYYRLTWLAALLFSATSWLGFCFLGCSAPGGHFLLLLRGLFLVVIWWFKYCRVNGVERSRPRTVLFLLVRLLIWFFTLHIVFDY
jgi:hypothetical protein